MSVTPVAVPATPNRRPTSAPTAAPAGTPLPRATNTLVISKESVNDRLLEAIEQKMVVLRNLSLIEPVTKRFLTETDLRELLNTWYARGQPARGSIRQAAVVSVLGFVRPDEDLNLIQSELMARSVAGLYSALDKQLYIVSDRWNMTASEEMTFAHEFTHAMQDQHYHLFVPR